ncbi:hypothetical protein BV898_05179 [Hypsibius exemplaris]|uniref:Uncharacterized protein n=1 Tax=Hypsibius exemplaris TaxID=2072580 RepID=A0A1W0X078_HYPEX|nr:hypothetical protein BV898_05179 [Hypsibius exemplaris]
MSSSVDGAEVVVSIPEAKDFIRRCMEKAGATCEHSHLMADVLVMADQRSQFFPRFKSPYRPTRFHRNISYKHQPRLCSYESKDLAAGKVEIAMRKNHAIPAVWGVDSTGTATTNPADVYHSGGLLPSGGQAKNNFVKRTLRIVSMFIERSDTCQ